MIPVRAVVKDMLCVLLSAMLLPGSAVRPANTRIAIIGGGISGTSTAYWLRELLGESVDLVLFEGGNVGGRISTIMIDGHEFETGGTVIHMRNHYASSFAKKFGLEKKPILAADGVLGLVDGNKFVFLGSKIKYWNIAKLVWRYHFDLFRLENYGSELVSRFSRIYDLQQNNKSYAHVSDLMSAIDPLFVEYMHVSSKDGFDKEGFNSKIINELIQASLKSNYGQTTSVNQFVGSVSIAGDSNELFSIVGGNKLLPRHLLDASKAKLVPSFVKKVIATGSEPAKYRVTSTETNEIDYDGDFDFVVISTPLTKDLGRSNMIEFEGFPRNISIPGKYWTTVCTIVKGDINPRYFGFKTPQELPDLICSINDESLFNFIGKIYPVRKSSTGIHPYVWKIFSKTVLTDDQLHSLFDHVDFVKYIDWLAYPDYSSMAEDYDFILSDDIFYTNAMEWSASAIETGMIGARNVALLINQKLRDNETVTSDSSDSSEVPRTSHDEM